jgi:3-phenylpropionate/trans-cinnamate dioxygenase ferredoxin reductase component
MKTYQYLIVGGGMTAAAAVDGIRDADSGGSIGLFAAESDPPYDRPPLSKALWKGKSEDTIWRKIDPKQVEIHLGRVVQEIDARRKCIVDDQRNVFTYEKLLLATGGQPRRLPFGGDRIVYFRTLSDYRRLRALAETGRRFAVIGGGFIGSEIAAALALNGKEVVMLFPGKAIGDRLFPNGLAQYVTRYYQNKGVDVRPGERVTGLEARGSRQGLKTASGQELVVDGVVAGIGIEPNVELAQAMGLKIENGIVVNEFLGTSQSDILAAGDVAAFENPALGKRVRFEHEDNANTMGRCAGRNMAGRPEAYRHLPFFYSDLFELGYEAVGELDSRLETYEDWTKPNEEGVIYYLRDGRVRGVLLWNVWNQVDAARELIAAPGPFDSGNLHGRLKSPVAS